jgi:hypothetical protein
MVEEIVSEERTVATYAQPLSRLQVSWGAILAGALATTAVSLLLWSLALAIILSATNATVGSLQGSMIAAWVFALLTTLAGAFVGGAVAGYLPGNPRKLITVAHGFLAWAVAFMFSAAMQWSMVTGLTQFATSTVVSTAGAAVQSAGSAVGGAAAGAAAGQPRLESNAVSVLESLGYSPAESRGMVESARGSVQEILRGQRGKAEAAQAGAQVRGALDTMINSAALYTWLWFATWAIAAGLAMLGATMVLPRVRRVPEREMEGGREPLHVLTARHAEAR